MSAVTPWFPANVKPIRVGVYQTVLGYQHWNGEFWGQWSRTQVVAFRDANRKSQFQTPLWRGLASDPNEAPVGTRGPDGVDK